MVDAVQEGLQERRRKRIQEQAKTEGAADATVAVHEEEASSVEEPNEQALASDDEAQIDDSEKIINLQIKYENYSCRSQ